MNPAAKHNSTVAYNAIDDLVERKERVYRIIARYPNVSRNDIARITGMMPSNVSSRICELGKEGYITSSGKRRDRITGRTVRMFVVTGKQYPTEAGA